MGLLIEMYKQEVANREERKKLGLPLDRPHRRLPAKVFVSRPGVDMSIPESERRDEREPGEEG